MMYYNDGFYPSHMYGFNPFGFVLQIFLGILVIFLIIAIVRRIRGGHRHHFMCCGEHGGNAIEILKERYAKGEITKEQFESMKKDLEQ